MKIPNRSLKLPKGIKMSSRSLIGLLCSALCGATAFGQTDTTFTYQGRLESMGMPFDGVADLRFTLWDDAIDGSIVGSASCSDDLDVADGLFTAALDFGAGFDGSPRFVQIAVRTNAAANCADTSGFTILSPRQPLTATPHAISAQRVVGIDGHSLDGASGGPIDALFVDQTGMVGIGTTTPAFPLDVDGDAQVSGRVQVFGNVEIQAGESVLDQQQTDHDLVAGIGVLWQSFTPSVSGLLTQVEYYAAAGTTPSGASLMLRQGEGPNGAVLAGARYTLTPNLGPISITLDSAPTLIAGQVYTMMFVPDDGIAHGVGGECCNVYPGGRSNFDFDPTIDIYFKTYMLVGGQNGLGRLGVGTASPKEAIHNTGDYYGRGHFLLHAFEGDGLSGTAYLQARDDSNVSSIGLRLRTQHLGSLHDAIHIASDADVGIGTNNPASRLHLVHAPTGSSSTLNWGLRMQTTAQSAFVAGMRVSDSGFFDICNQIGGPGFARLSNNGLWSAVSDRRMKRDIAALGGVLESALKLEPVSYYYVGQDRTQSPDRQIGFIAQDVEPLFPSLVTKGDDLMTLNYSGLSVVAIAALQEMKIEQDASNTQQGMEVAQLRSENDALLERIAALERRLARIEHAFGVDKPQ